MNHLAHFLLSGKNPDMIIGNFITDYIRKSEVGSFTPAIQQGIQLHRFIDSYTDSHLLTKECVSQMRKSQGKYTPVVMDICFDHLLAINWSNFSDSSLREFTTEIYQLLVDREAQLPLRLSRNLKGMIEGDWLFEFANKKGLSFTFSMLGRRVKFDHNLEQATDDLYSDLEFYNSRFLTFYKDLSEKCKLEREAILRNEEKL